MGDRVPGMNNTDCDRRKRSGAAPDEQQLIHGSPLAGTKIEDHECVFRTDAEHPDLVRRRWRRAVLARNGLKLRDLGLERTHLLARLIQFGGIDRGGCEPGLDQLSREGVLLFLKPPDISFVRSRRLPQCIEVPGEAQRSCIRGFQPGCACGGLRLERRNALGEDLGTVDRIGAFRFGCGQGRTRRSKVVRELLASRAVLEVQENGGADGTHGHAAEKQG